MNQCNVCPEIQYRDSTGDQTSFTNQESYPRRGAYIFCHWILQPYNTPCSAFIPVRSLVSYKQTITSLLLAASLLLDLSLTQTLGTVCSVLSSPLETMLCGQEPMTAPANSQREVKSSTVHSHWGCTACQQTEIGVWKWACPAECGNGRCFWQCIIRPKGVPKVENLAKLFPNPHMQKL